jgi:hypothetical protein
VNNFGKAFRGPPTHTLRWTVRSDELRMLCFKLLEILHELIVFTIGDLRSVPNVVEVIMTTNLVSEFFDLAQFGFLFSHGLCG